MKNIAFKLLTLLGLAGCNQTASNQTNGQTFADKEVFTLYSKADSLVRVARVLTSDNKTFDLHFYEVDIATPEGAKQKFISTEQLTQQQLDSKKTELLSTYNWTPFKGNDVLFVQIQPTGFKDEMQLLDKRQEIEDKLSKAFEDKNLGEWFAGDLGPGGGNMLYTVHNIEQALQTTLQVLQQNKLDKNVLIGRRVLVADGDWFYEVIYPTKYSGDFNTM